MVSYCNGRGQVRSSDHSPVPPAAPELPPTPPRERLLFIASHKIAVGWARPHVDDAGVDRSPPPRVVSIEKLDAGPKVLCRPVGNVTVAHHSAKALDGSLQVRRLDLCDMAAGDESGVACKVSGGPQSVSSMRVPGRLPARLARRTW